MGTMTLLFSNGNYASSEQANLLDESIFPFLPEVILLAFSTVTVLIAAKGLQTNPKAGRIVILAIVFFVLSITLNPFFVYDYGWQTIIGRLKGLAYIQAALMVPLTIWVLREKRKELTIYALAIVFPLILMSAFSPPPYGMQPEYLRRRQQLMQYLLEVRSFSQKIEMVIAPHGDQFLVTHLLKVPSQQVPSEPNSYKTV